MNYIYANLPHPRLFEDVEMSNADDTGYELDISKTKLLSLRL